MIQYHWQESLDQTPKRKRWHCSCGLAASRNKWRSATRCNEESRSIIIHGTIRRGDCHGNSARSTRVAPQQSHRKRLPGHQLDLYRSRVNRKSLHEIVVVVVPGAVRYFAMPHEQDVVVGGFASECVCACLCGVEETLEDDAGGVAGELVTVWKCARGAPIGGDGVHVLDCTGYSIVVVVREGC